MAFAGRSKVQKECCYHPGVVPLLTKEQKWKNKCLHLSRYRRKKLVQCRRLRGNKDLYVCFWFQEHVNVNCEYREILCQNDCGAKFQKRFLQKHLDRDCPKKIIACPYCDDRHMREDKKVKYLVAILIKCENSYASKTSAIDLFSLYVLFPQFRHVTVTFSRKFAFCLFIMYVNICM